MNITDWCMSVWRYIRSIRPIAGPGLSSQQTSSGTLISLNGKGGGTDTKPPFTVTIAKKDDEWKASITRGVVSERIITQDGDTVKYWEPSGMLEKDGKSILITIAAGDGLFVVVKVNASGEIVSVSIATEPAADVSVSHYAPAVGNDPGSSGTYKYRLGKLKVEGETGKFIPDMAGSNIDHCPILPKFKKQAGDRSIFKKFDVAEQAYKFKGLTEDMSMSDGLGEETKTVRIEDTGDELKLRTHGQTREVVFRACPGDDGGTGTVKLRFVIFNGSIVGIDKEEPKSDSVMELTLPDCCIVE